MIRFVSRISSIFILLFLSQQTICAQCEADHVIVMADYYFAPSELTIVPGETVAFVNVQGTHDVNGSTNSLTGEPLWNNPEAFYLSQTEGTEEGVCMGVITFNVPGVYNFDSSIGFQAQLGMVGSITVDAFTVLDMMQAWNGEEDSPQAWQSVFAMQNYCEPTLNGIGEYTVFLPNDDAISDLREMMNLNQFDMFGIPDFQDILNYHIIEGVYLAEDLEPGMALPTVQGEVAFVGQSPQGLTIDGVNIVETNYVADNGVVHIIDYGMAPSSSPEATVYEIIVQSPDHTLFEQEVNNNFLNDDLISQPVINDNEDAPGHFTVFAPTDAAIEAFAEENGFDDIDDLFDSPFWGEVMLRHIVETPLISSQFFNNQSLISYGGETIVMSVGDDGIFVEDALITQTDLMAYNGVVHVIDEVMDYEFPNPVGTCGTWTLNMYEPGGNGWSGVMQIFRNGVLIASPTILDGSFNSYPFAVDDGDTVDILYISMYAGWNGNFEVVDAEGSVMFNSNAPSNTTSPYGGTAAGVFGLRACEETSSCGSIKINLYDAQGDGWDVGSLYVYDGPLLVDIIGGNWYNGDHIISFLELENGSDVDFVVNGGAYADENGFTVEDAEGNLLVDETSQGSAPQSAFDVVFCDVTNAIEEGMVSTELPLLYPNPAKDHVFISRLGKHAKWSFRLLNSQGKEVRTAQGFGPSQISVDGIASGLYIANLELLGGNTIIYQLMVE
ncbi:MAG: fasciclin domain-containing protein [Flavobacteriales bacterium]